MRIAIAPATALAEWLAINEPALFSALEREAATQSAQLNGITDFLSSVGSSIGSAVSSVGKYLASEKGIATLTGIGSAYLSYQTQKDVLSTQVALASAGQPPAPITNTIGANGQLIPVYTPTNQVATPQLLMSLQPNFFEQYKIPILIGGGVLALLLVSTTLRS